jgi:GNAT superfamily N-acetyltransferase
LSGAEQAALSTIQKLASGHNTETFDCGKEALNRFLIRHALTSQQANSAQTYVATRAGVVVAYYSLAVGAVAHEDAPLRIGKGLARHPIPVMVLARLAVDLTEHGRGLGKGLLKDALRRTVAAAEIAGIRAILVTAKDDEAQRFYEHYNFDPSPGDPHQLFLVMKDLRAMI